MKYAMMSRSRRVLPNGAGLPGIVIILPRYRPQLGKYMLRGSNQLSNFKTMLDREVDHLDLQQIADLS